MTDAEIMRVWNRWGKEDQNMPFQQFRKECKALSDPVKMQRDLQDIELRKARQRSNQIRIDRGMKNGS